MLKDYIQLGETMDIEVAGVATKTKVQDLLDDDQFIVSQPTVKLIPLVINANDSVRFTFFRPNGIYMFQAELVERVKKGNLSLCIFKATSAIEKKQRRYGYRLPIILQLTVKTIAENDEKEIEYKAKTVNISEKGILFSCFKFFEKGTKLMVNLILEKFDQLLLQAEVVRCEPPEQKTDPYLIAVQFCNCSKSDQMHIGRYILKRQIFERKLKELNGC